MPIQHEATVLDHAHGAVSNFDIECSCGARISAASLRLEFVAETWARHLVRMEGWVGDCDMCGSSLSEDEDGIYCSDCYLRADGHPYAEERLAERSWL